MTSRERILAALAHKEPDRVPIDLGGTESSGMTAVAYANLCEHVGVNDVPRVFDVFQQVALVSDEVRRRFHIDTQPLAFEPSIWSDEALSDGRRGLGPALWQPETCADGSRLVRTDDGTITAAMPAGGFYYDSAWCPLASVTSARELDAFARAFEEYDRPVFLDEGWDAMAKRARALHTGGDHCVVANLALHLLAGGQGLRGYERFMMDLVADEALAEAVLERLLETYLGRVDVFAEKMAEWVDVVLLNDDLGTQSGPMLSPATYRKRIKPLQARLFEHVKRRTGKPILFHSCGSVYRFIGDLIEVGVDALNPVQVSAADMDSRALKREFGRDITFWGGGCDTQTVLGSGSPEEVRAEVKRRIDDLAPGGGFVFTQVHNVQPNVPPENVVAMLEAAYEYGAR